MQNDLNNIKIAIIGGGIAGFAAGIAFLQNGYKNVTMYYLNKS